MEKETIASCEDKLHMTGEKKRGIKAYPDKLSIFHMVYKLAGISPQISPSVVAVFWAVVLPELSYKTGSRAGACALACDYYRNNSFSHHNSKYQLIDQRLL